MRNRPAFWSVVVGLLAAGSLPAAVVFAERSARVELLWAGLTVPVAFVLGVAAIVLARRGRRRAELSVLRRSGAGAATIGRLLGMLALLLSASGVTALVVYALLTYRGDA